MTTPFTREELHAIPGEDLEALGENASEIRAELAAGFYRGDPTEERLQFWSAQILGELSRRWHESSRATPALATVADDAPF